MVAVKDRPCNECIWMGRSGMCSSWDCEPVTREQAHKLIDFADFVAESVTADDFDDSAGFFAEVACRKLYKIGILGMDDENWIYNYEERNDSNDN